MASSSDGDKRYVQWLNCFSFIFDVEITDILIDLEHLKSIVKIDNITVTDEPNHWLIPDKDLSVSTWKIVNASRNRDTTCT